MLIMIIFRNNDHDADDEDEEGDNADVDEECWLPLMMLQSQLGEANIFSFTNEIHSHWHTNKSLFQHKSQNRDIDEERWLPLMLLQSPLGVDNSQPLLIMQHQPNPSPHFSLHV